MAYEIVFEAGSLKGRRWRIPDGGVLTIGRSHLCGVRPKEPDVSGRHAVVSEEGGVVWLEVLSSHKTDVDGIRLQAGKKVAITEVSRITLGGSAAFRIARVGDADAETGEIPPAETATLGGPGTVATAATRAGETGFMGGDTATLTGTAMTAATRAAGGAVQDGDTGTVATAATRAMPAGAVARADDMGYDTDTSILPGKPDGRDGRMAAETAGEETYQGDSQDGGETQMLQTQAVTPAELERLRGAHIQRQRRRIGFRALGFALAFAAVFGLYLWLSNPSVNPYLIAPSKISFNGIIRTEGGSIGVMVPNVNGGRPTLANDSVVIYETRLGDNWEVPFTIVLTNYVDKSSLYEDAATSFARWRRANMIGLWVDRGESDRRHIFLGGMNGAYPGIPCLQHNYTRVGEDRENILGTATFFRIGARCYVLLRELPASEEPRGVAWLTEILATLYVQAQLSNGVDNLIVARHWEGIDEPDAEENPADIVKDCREALRSGAQAKWERIRKRLYVAMRMLEGRTDTDSNAIRGQALDTLQLLRKCQAEFWNASRLEADQIASTTRDDAKNRLRWITESVKAKFKAEDDSRHWILGNERWWAHRESGD